MKLSNIITELAPSNQQINAVMLHGEGNPDWGRDLHVYDPEKHTFPSKQHLEQYVSTNFASHTSARTAQEAINEFADFIGLEQRDPDWHGVTDFVQQAKNATTFIVGTMAPGEYQHDDDDDDDDDDESNIHHASIIAF